MDCLEIPMKKYSLSVFFLLFMIVFTGSFILFSLPGSSLPKYNWLEIPHLDKYIHIGIFFTLCYSCAISLRKIINTEINKIHALVVCLLFIVYGIGIEYYQESFVEGRAFEIADILADGLGCWIFVIVFLIWGLPKKSWSR